jgi:putative metallohydrolase (TIGR04338 family)
MKYDNIEYQSYLLKHARKQNRGASGQDSERQKTYRAEWAFQARVPNPTFKSIEDAQKYAKKIYKSKTWQKLWSENVQKDVMTILRSTPKVVAKQRNSGRGTSGWTNGYSVTLDTMCGLNVYTLLHELAHCLGNMHHGRSFRKTVLSLVSRFMGRDAAKVLKEEFKKQKLACGEERKPMTFEQWKASRDRMAKIREKLNNG